MRKETLVFLASLAIIFIIGYINMSLTPDNAFDDIETGKMEPADLEGDIAEIIEGGVNEVDFAEVLPEETDYEILGDITDLSSAEEASSEGVLGVLNASFAFNLLMGRRWPAWPDDLREAEAICYELGLGPLLERMPLGIHQRVGEQGWRLSHGERSRLYIARALLQRSDLVILDESFASLDPENMQVALECVLKRAPTLLVIAHP